MLTVETKLARWRVFYDKWCAVDKRLQQARRDGAPTTAQLELEVREAQDSCNSSLDEVSAALAARRSPQASKRSMAVA